MYNAELKERFLKESLKNYEENSIKNMRYILEKAEKTEMILNKDIYEMTADESKNLLGSYSNRTPEVVKVNISILKSYVDFCIEEGYVPDRYNYFTVFFDMTDHFVNKEYYNNRFITREEINEAQDNYLANAQDSAFLELIFIGLKGEACSEIINLREENVKQDKIILPDREIAISQRTYNLIQQAIKQKHYLKNNGEPSENMSAESMPMPRTGYVIKSGGKKKDGKMPYQTLRIRLGRIIKYLGNKNLTFNSIGESGMLDMAKRIKAEKGEVTKQDWLDIVRIYGRNELYWFKYRARLSEFL